MEALLNPDLESYQFTTSDLRMARLRLIPGPTDRDLENEEDESEKPEPTELPKRFHKIDTLTIYLREIGQTSLIDAKEKIKLAQKIEEGINAARELANEQLDPDKISGFEEVMEIGQKAQRTLVEANLRLVVS